MQVTSLELSKKLKNAGLRWEPKEGDLFYPYSPFLRRHEKRLAVCPFKEIISINVEADEKDDIFAPRLDQLLAEIEKRGYRWDIGNLEDKPCIGLFDWETREYVMGLFYGETPTDAAGEALLWILEREVIDEI